MEVFAVQRAAFPGKRSGHNQGIVPIQLIAADDPKSRQVERRRRLDGVKAGDGWWVAPNPIPPDTSAEDAAWIAKFRMPQSARCFEQPLRLHTKLTLPRTYIQCMRYADLGPFGQFAARARAEGWQTYELDASHSPNVTAPGALMELLQRILSE